MIPIKKNYIHDERTIETNNLLLDKKIKSIKCKKSKFENKKKIKVKSKFELKNHKKRAQIEKENINMFNRLQKIYSKKKNIKDNSKLIKNQQKSLKIRRLEKQKKIEKQNEKFVFRILQKKSDLKKFFRVKEKKNFKNENKKKKKKINEDKNKIRLNKNNMIHEELIHRTEYSALVQIYRYVSEYIIHIYEYTNFTSDFSEKTFRLNHSQCFLKR